MIPPNCIFLCQLSCRRDDKGPPCQVIICLRLIKGAVMITNWQFILYAMLDACLWRETPAKRGPGRSLYIENGILQGGSEVTEWEVVGDGSLNPEISTQSSRWELIHFLRLWTVSMTTLTFTCLLPRSSSLVRCSPVMDDLVLFYTRYSHVLLLEISSTKNSSDGSQTTHFLYRHFVIASVKSWCMSHDISRANTIHALLFHENMCV